MIGEQVKNFKIQADKNGNHNFLDLSLDLG